MRGCAESARVELNVAIAHGVSKPSIWVLRSARRARKRSRKPAAPVSQLESKQAKRARGGVSVRGRMPVAWKVPGCGGGALPASDRWELPRCHPTAYWHQHRTKAQRLRTQTGGANCDARRVQNATLRASAAKCEDAKESPQVLADCSVTHKAEDPCTRVQGSQVGAEGFEPP